MQTANIKKTSVKHDLSIAQRGQWKYWKHSHCHEVSYVTLPICWHYLKILSENYRLS